MTHAGTLEQAIQKAIANGWELEDWVQGPQHLVQSLLLMSKVSSVIFNHDFAKALWGEELWWVALPGKSGEVRDELEIPAWQMHLQQMVVAPDPIVYLAENLPE